MRAISAILGLFVLLSATCAAAAAGCPEHFASGIAPALANPRLETRAQELCFRGYAVLHSGLTRTPLWSAEHLTAGCVEAARDVRRTNRFHPEKRLPPAERSELADYARSGYDRGHMAPSGDMPDAESQAESFSLANMIPQAHRLNTGLWSGIESVVRNLAQRGVRRHGKPVLPHSRCSWAAPTGGDHHIRGTLFHSEGCLFLVQVTVVLASGQSRRRPGGR